MTNYKRTLMDPTKKKYPELQGYRIRGQPAPLVEFPGMCPCCGSQLVEEIHDGWTDCATYACGGRYGPKPQIQDHTLVWWGSCGSAMTAPKGGSHD